ncbi:DUF3558 domain-containing protein [Saccharopolyspora sp. MS10]|uniref:DUF3558 domain-containing protein n=1 Tax=Saccharopolyspora sp. MS10 TaxID=3385973 RepID=UPI0039A3B3BE
MTSSLVRRGPVFAVLLSAVLLSGGCALGGGEAVEPQPAPAYPEQGSGLDLPPRPRDLPIAGMAEARICEIFSAEQLEQLGVGPGSPSPKNGTRNFPGCMWLSDPEAAASTGISVSVAPVGIAELEAQSQEGSPDTAASYTVGGGFGAVQSQIPGAESLGCTVDVDAAERSALEVGFAWQGGAEMTNQDMCAKAKQAAEFAVGNLRAQG